jgi:hypothetical protein
MRPFFVTVGILAWLWAFAVMWIFAENGGALTVIAAGVFAVVAIVALACERIMKLLEEIQQSLPQRRRVVPVRQEIAREPLPADRVPPAAPAHDAHPIGRPS